MSEGRVAIVTGAARGIGLAIAARLHADGAQVALADLNVTEARRQAEALGERAMPVEVNVADPKSAEELAEVVAGRWGRLDILVNNAGILGPTTPLVEFKLEDWRAILATNLDALFYTCRAVLPHMQRQGWGRIVNIASIAGKEGNPGMVAYSSSKAGVIGFTKALSKELATSGVLVNCITPAIIDTDMTRPLAPEARNYVLSRVPMNRIGQPEEIAAMAAWLCSEECSFSTGAVFDVSGGRASY
jgi:NAD(P)-dependent dehydrogenase (short-subunit alcohol dehydrogenase family)